MYEILNEQERETERDVPEEVEVQQISQKQNLSEDSEELFS